VFGVHEAVLIQGHYGRDASLPGIVVQGHGLASRLPNVATHLEDIAAAFVDEDQPAVQVVEPKQQYAPADPQLPQRLILLILAAYGALGIGLP